MLSIVTASPRQVDPASFFRGLDTAVQLVASRQRDNPSRGIQVQEEVPPPQPEAGDALGVQQVRQRLQGEADNPERRHHQNLQCPRPRRPEEGEMIL